MTSRALALVLLLLVLASSALSANTRTTTFAIRGMHCSSCAVGIESIVKRVDGVIKVKASYESRQARVEFDPAKTSNDKIAEAIERLGYQAAPKTK